jgi:hypothetical protein
VSKSSYIVANVPLAVCHAGFPSTLNALAKVADKPEIFVTFTS